MPEDRRLAAIMFTDIVGYTAIMGSDEDKAFKVLRKNREIQRPIIKKYRGEWLKEMGDGILASFHTASDAVRCAGEIQQAAKKVDITLRIGIHEGEVVFEGGDVLGDGVNVASRLEEMAEDGAINISGAVYKDIRNKAGITAEFIEEKELKNVEEPVKVYKVICEEEDRKEESTKGEGSKKSRNKMLYYIIAGLVIVIAAILIWQYLPTEDTDIQSTEITTEVIEKSIAVLPFRNDSPDQENEYFCNGMMEEILDKLHKIGEINVLSRTATEQYRNTTIDPKKIAEELGVANVLEGSVRKSGERFRINVQLIQAGTGFHLWSDVFDGIVSDTIFIVQSMIAEEIAVKLNAAITPLERQHLEKSPTSDIRAYEKFIKGRASLHKFWSYFDKKDFEMAENLFRESLEIDPEFDWGYAGLGQIYHWMAQSNPKLWDTAYYYAEKAIEYDHYNDLGYGLIGDYYQTKGDFDKALDFYKKAIDINPSFAWYHEQIWRLYFNDLQNYRIGLPYLKKAEELIIKQKDNLEHFYHRVGVTYLHIGDYEKAEQYFKSSLESNPICPVIQHLTWLKIINKEWGEAFEFLDSTIIELPLCSGLNNLFRFRIHLYQKEFDQAEKYWNLPSEEGRIPWLMDSIDLAYMNIKLGREQEALKILNNFRYSLESKLAEKATFITSFILSEIHAILDEKKEALKYLSEAEELGFEYGYHDLIEFFPPFENIWGDPEFKAIVKRAQDEKAAIRAQVRKAEVEEELDL